MSKIYRKYESNVDHVWYDSSNILYSEGFDMGGKVSLKIVFKGGRTYLYKNVETQDYTLFRDAESNGKVFNERIKNYDTVKIDDADIEYLERLKQRYIDADNETSCNYIMEYNNGTGELKVWKNNLCVYEGYEGRISLVTALTSMGINFEMVSADVHVDTVDEFEANTINK